MQSVSLRCPSCGYAFGLVVYAPQDTTVQCPNCKTPVRLYLPAPPPGSLRFSWEYSGEPAPASGVRLLPKSISTFLPIIALVAGILVLASSIAAVSFVYTPGSGDMTLHGRAYAVVSGSDRYLSGVRVEVKDMGLVTFTDDGGNYELQRVPIGEHVLRITLDNYSIAEYHLVAFPVLAERYDLEMRPGSGYGSFDAGRFSSLYDIQFAVFSSAGELLLVSSLLLVSAVLILRRRQLVLVLASLFLGCAAVFLMLTELTVPWALLAAASVLSFSGMIFTWLGRDEFEDKAKWTIG